MTISMGHVAITVKDMEESIRFYTQALGFCEAFTFCHPLKSEQLQPANRF